jgi:hypothetical protein
VTSRSRLLDRVARANARAETAEATLRALEDVAGELSRAKDVIAQVVTAAGHPDSAVQDVRAFATALVEQLAAAGVDIQIELHRTEGARL